MLDPSKLKESVRLIKMILALVDRSVTLRLSQANRLKADKCRKAVEKIKQQEKKDEKEEEVLRKKREEEQKYNEKIKSLPPDQ